jgi:dolichyl-phosphate-mannose-protein mannosyltransferase
MIDRERKDVYSLIASLIHGCDFVLDNALVTQSRLIMLDGMLLFFTVLAIFSWTRFEKCRER